MAWAKEINETITIDDWGPAGTTFAGCYAKATLKITTSGDTVNYKITMQTSVDGGTSQKPAVALYLKIDDKVILNKYWNYNTNSDGWNNFPTYNGSTYSGTLTTAAKNDTSIPVILKIATSQNAISNSNAWKEVSKSLTRTWYTEVGTGKTTIKDNGNNTFTITAEPGADGTNNSAYVAGIYWGYDTNYKNEYRGKVNLTISGTGNTRTVYAKSITKGDYGSSKTATTSLAVKQYFVPYAPTKLKITHTKSRLTIKENWTCKWTASKAPNSNSAVKGYKIMIYKSGTPINGIKIDSNNKITKDRSTGTTKYNYVHVGADVTKVKVDPVSLGLAPGNKVKFSVTPYTVWGYNTSVKQYGAIKISNEETVQNAGIMYVKINGTWREGQVYVKNSGTWKEAEAIYVKNSGTWKESQ